MSDQVLFGTQAFGGFNKEDVLKYIDKLSLEHSGEMEKTQNECADLRNELVSKNEMLAQKEENFNELLSAYEELRQHYMSLKEKFDNLEFENEKLIESNENLKKELTAKENYCRKIEEDNKKTVGASVSLEQIENGAKTVLFSAKDGAQNIVRDAQKSVGNVNSELQRFKIDVTKTREYMEDSFAAIIARIESLSENMSSVCDDKNNESLTESVIRDKYEKAVENLNRVMKSFKDNILR